LFLKTVDDGNSGFGDQLHQFEPQFRKRPTIGCGQHTDPLHIEDEKNKVAFSEEENSNKCKITLEKCLQLYKHVKLL
jgi:hypothetical protein